MISLWLGLGRRRDSGCLHGHHFNRSRRSSSDTSTRTSEKSQLGFDASVLKRPLTIEEAREINLASICNTFDL